VWPWVGRVDVVLGPAFCRKAPATCRARDDPGPPGRPRCPRLGRVQLRETVHQPPGPSLFWLSAARPLGPRSQSAREGVVTPTPRCVSRPACSLNCCRLRPLPLPPHRVLDSGLELARQVPLPTSTFRPRPSWRPNARSRPFHLSSNLWPKRPRPRSAPPLLPPLHAPGEQRRLLSALTRQLAIPLQVALLLPAGTPELRGQQMPCTRVSCRGSGRRCPHFGLACQLGPSDLLRTA
jgi:hypothetical protein